LLVVIELHQTSSLLSIVRSQLIYSDQPTMFRAYIFDMTIACQTLYGISVLNISV